MAKNSSNLGNPVAVLSAMEILKSPVVKTGLKVLGVATGGYIAYRLITGGIDNYRANKAIKSAGDQTKSGLAYKFATEIRATNLGNYFANTNEEALYKIASQIYENKIPFDLVATQYNRLYSRSLENDLTDLNSSEREKWNNALQYGIVPLDGLGTISVAEFI